MLSSAPVRGPLTGLRGVDNLHYENAPGKGIYTIDRHPMMAAISLWALAHLFARGDVAAILFFGEMFTLPIIGIMHIDRRRDAAADEA